MSLLLRLIDSGPTRPVLSDRTWVSRVARTLGVIGVALCSLVPQSLSTQAALYAWHTGSPMSMARRYPAAVTGKDGLIYVFGGLGRPVPGVPSFPLLETVEAYDPASGTWNMRAPMPSGRAQMAAALGADGRIYLFGGTNKHGFLNGLLIYDPVADSWTTGAPMPTSREQLAAATGPDGKIYVIGGYNQVGARRKLEIYDPRTNSWTVGRPMPIGGYGLGAATGLDGKIYAISGYRQNYGNPTLDIGGTLPYVQTYDPATDAWTAQASFPTPRMSLGVVRGKDGRIYASGGTHPYAGSLDAVEAYDPTTGRWSSMAPMPTGRADLAAAVGHDGSIYAIGGFAGHTSVLNPLDSFLKTVDVYAPQGTYASTRLIAAPHGSPAIA